MKRLQTSLVAAAGVLMLVFVLNAVGSKRVMAALGFTPVRDVTNPALQPFAHLFFLNFSASDDSDSITVPPGKRLVIETVSVRGFLSTGLKADFKLQATTSFANVSYVFPTTSVGNFLSRDRLESTQSVHIYADPGTLVSVSAQKNSSGGSAVAEYSISGHLVDLP
jgi:hypothetical protein